VNRVDGEDLELDAAALLRLIGHVDYAQCAAPEKYNICGVFLQIKDDDEGCSRLYAAATDGHRLAADSVPLPGDPRVIPADLAKGIIIPRKGIAELKKISPEGVLILQILGNNLSISTENETFTLRLVDGQFPDIQRIIPTKILGSAHFNRQPLIDALDRVSLLSEGKSHAVTLSFDDGHIQLDSQNPELGEAHDRVAAALEGELSYRKLNAAYLVQALSVWDCGVVQINLAGDLDPILVTPYGETEPLAVIMPLRG
jgi:DNA polymerase-3 subunit beta